MREDQKFDNYGGIIRVFSLTSQGITEVQVLLENPKIKEQFEIIRSVKKAYNAMSVVELVDYTHKAYKEYATRAFF